MKLLELPPQSVQHLPDNLALTTTSGPGLALKTEAMGLSCDD